MPIAFACECGKPFTVADEYAGKRTKCPTCGAALTVPLPESEPEQLSEEDKAFRALAEDPEPAARPPVAQSGAWSEDAPRPAPGARAPISGALPTAKRGPKVARRSSDDRERSRTSGIHLTPAVWGGLFSMLIGGGWFLFVWSNGGFSIYGPILFIGGLVSVVRGLLGYSED
jgi:hypothetical protein